MKVIDEILAALEDGQWHSIEDVQRQVKLDPENVGLIWKFLEEYGFVEVDMKEKKGKLTPQVQSFLKELKAIF